MGESGSRRTEGTPALDPTGRKGLLLLFIAATFGLMVLLSVPISRYLPLPLGVPRVIEHALAPFEPILPPFLPELPGRGAGHTASPSPVLALKDLVALPGAGTSQVASPGTGGVHPVAARSGSKLTLPAKGGDTHGPSTPGNRKAADRRRMTAAGDRHPPKPKGKGDGGKGKPGKGTKKDGKKGDDEERKPHKK